MKRAAPGQPRLVHRLQWLWEPLESDPTFVLRSMFGGKSAYLDGRIVLHFVTGEEPWCGMLVTTFREHHASLMQEFPALSPHPVLGKWLYLPETHDAFETVAVRLVTLAQKRDPRIGAAPSAKKRRKRQGP